MTQELEFDERWNGASISKEHWHFHAKLFERYYLVLQPGEFSLIMKSLKEGNLRWIERRKDGTDIFSCRVKSARKRIYLLCSGHRILTAWPPDKRLKAILKDFTYPEAVKASEPN